MKFYALLLLGIVFSCASVVSEEDRNKKLATQMFQSFNDHNWTKMTQYYSSDALYLDPAYGSEFVKKSSSEIIEKYSAMEQLFPDIHDSLTAIHASGNKVTIEFVSTGSSGDSISFKLPICTVLTFQNGIIVRDATYYDNN